MPIQGDKSQKSVLFFLDSHRFSRYKTTQYDKNFTVMD